VAERVMIARAAALTGSNPLAFDPLLKLRETGDFTVKLFPCTVRI